MAAQKFTFIVKGEVENDPTYNSETVHYREERRGRADVIERYIGFGEDVLSFLVDTHHPNGWERHVLTSTGIIKVFNDRTKRHVNDLIARPGQIRRYFAEGKVPAKYRYICDIAREHQLAGYNQV